MVMEVRKQQLGLSDSLNLLLPYCLSVMSVIFPLKSGSSAIKNRQTAVTVKSLSLHIAASFRHTHFQKPSQFWQLDCCDIYVPFLQSNLLLPIENMDYFLALLRYLITLRKDCLLPFYG